MRVRRGVITFQLRSEKMASLKKLLFFFILFQYYQTAYSGWREKLEEKWREEERLAAMTTEAKPTITLLTDITVAESTATTFLHTTELSTSSALQTEQPVLPTSQAPQTSNAPPTTDTPSASSSKPLPSEVLPTTEQTSTASKTQTSSW